MRFPQTYYLNSDTLFLKPWLNVKVFYILTRIRWHNDENDDVCDDDDDDIGLVSGFGRVFRRNHIVLYYV